MDKNGMFLAAMLESASKAYAAGVATRVLEELPDLAEERGFAELSEEAELHIRLLGEASAAGRPELFAAEFAWLKVLYAARGQDWKRLDTELAAIKDEIVERLPPTSTDQVPHLVETARCRLAEAPTETPGFLEDGDGPHVDLARRYLLAILEGRGGDALALVLNAAETGTPIDALHDHVIVPVQSELGRMWQMGEVHVGDEHLGTATAEEALTLLRARIPRPAAGARKVLAAGTPGAAHDLGLRLAADRLRMAGWEAIVLGADMPSEDCARAVQDHGADLVAVSIPMLLNLRSGHELVTEIKGVARVPVLVGGRPFAEVDDLWEVVGADGSARGAADVVASAERLVQNRSA